MPRLTAGRTAPTALVAVLVLAGASVAQAAPVSHPGVTGPRTAVVDAELSGDITFSRPGGTFQGRVSVSLTTAMAGAQVRYTTNGTWPTAASPLATGPIEIARTTEIRAQAFVSGSPTGKRGSAQYVATNVTTAHDLPVLVLDTYGAGAATDADKNVAVVELEPGNGPVTLAGTPTVTTRAGIRLRGNSSRMFEKIPYRLELWDNDDDGANLPFFGMPKDDDWVLRGPFSDKSLVREALVLDLAREMGLASPRYELVEVYVNTDAQPVSSSDYQGVYMLEEMIEDNARRLDLQTLKDDDLAEPEITGGYIFSVEWQAAEQPLLQCTGATNCWRDIELRRPNDPQPQQVQWISNHLSRFQQALDASSWNDPQRGYPAWIDVDSFVDHMIVNELSRNMDAYVRSTYFYKDRGGKITAGPVWDFDLTFGVGAYFGNEQTSGWQYQSVSQRQPAAQSWYTRLVQDPAFQNRLRARWQELRRGLLSDAQLTARVRSLTAPLTAAAARNYQRYPSTLTARMVGPFVTTTTPTWQGQVDDMTRWMLERARWLDTAQAWGGSTTPVPDPGTDPDPDPTPDPTPDPGGAGCTARYAVASRWNGGFQSEVTVTAGTSDITRWTVTLALPSGQSITQAWSAEVTGRSGTVTATNLAWNGSVRAGTSTTFGFIGSGDGATAPTVSCTAG